MRIKSPAVLLFIVLLAAAGAAGAHGQERSPFFGIGIHGNYYRTGDADDGSIRGGLQARLRLTQNISIEGAADYRKEEFDDGNITVEGYPFQLSGLWYLFGRGGINPHLIFGGSWYNSDITVRSAGGLSQEYSSDDFGYHGGFGLELHFTERSYFHADLRYMFLDIDWDVGLDSGLGDTSVDSNGYVIQAGLTFYF